MPDSSLVVSITSALATRITVDALESEVIDDILNDPLLDPLAQLRTVNRSFDETSVQRTTLPVLLVKVNV